MITPLIDFYETDPEDAYLPSPERIRRMCAEFRSGWTQTVRQTRSVYQSRRWTVPTVTFCLESSVVPEE